jgi:hypothetical protein
MRNIIAITSLILALSIYPGLAVQTHVMEKTNKLGDEQQLDLLLSGGESGSSSTDPLYGLYSMPNSGTFKNDSNFARFMSEFYAELAPPQINYTWSNIFFSGLEGLDLAYATNDAPYDPKKGGHVPSLLVKES